MVSSKICLFLRSASSGRSCKCFSKLFLRSSFTARGVVSTPASAADSGGTSVAMIRSLKYWLCDLCLHSCTFWKVDSCFGSW